MSCCIQTHGVWASEDPSFIFRSAATLWVYPLRCWGDTSSSHHTPKTRNEKVHSQMLFTHYHSCNSEVCISETGASLRNDSEGKLAKVSVFWWEWSRQDVLPRVSLRAIPVKQMKDSAHTQKGRFVGSEAPTGIWRALLNVWLWVSVLFQRLEALHQNCSSATLVGVFADFWLFLQPTDSLTNQLVCWTPPFLDQTPYINYDPPLWPKIMWSFLV